MPAPVRTCGFCGKGPFPSINGLHCHIQQAVACRIASQKEFGKYVDNMWNEVPAAETLPSEPSIPQVDIDEEELARDLDEATNVLDEDRRGAAEDTDRVVDDPPVQSRRSATVEEVPDEGDKYPGARFVETCPPEWKAGAIWGHGVPEFEKIYQAEGDNKWGPFQDQEEWELAQWLIRNAGT